MSWGPHDFDRCSPLVLLIAEAAVTEPVSFRSGLRLPCPKDPRQIVVPFFGFNLIYTLVAEFISPQKCTVVFLERAILSQSV